MDFGSNESLVSIVVALANVFYLFAVIVCVIALGYIVSGLIQLVSQGLKFDTDDYRIVLKSTADSMFYYPQKRHKVFKFWWSDMYLNTYSTTPMYFDKVHEAEQYIFKVVAKAKKSDSETVKKLSFKNGEMVNDCCEVMDV